MAAATPYALGRFRAHTDFGPRVDDFTGVIIGSEAAPLAALLPATPDLDALLADWPASSKLLGDAVEESRAGQRWASLGRPVSDFTRLAPVRPGQIFQSGANYKTHVVQLMMASAAENGDDDPEATRRHATALMERTGGRRTPYVFIGLPARSAAPTTTSSCPTWDPARLGARAGGGHRHHAYRVGVERPWTTSPATPSPTTSPPGHRVPAGHAGLGTDWLRSKNSPRSPRWAVARARAVRSPTRRPAGHAQAQRRDHAGRDHRGHDLRRRPS